MDDPRRERRPRYAPGRRALALEFYLRLVMRYAVGGGGVTWELVVDKGRNPLVLLVVGMLATSTDVLGVVRGLIAQAKAEQKSLEDLLNEERRGSRDRWNLQAESEQESSE